LVAVPVAQDTPHPRASGGSPGPGPEVVHPLKPIRNLNGVFYILDSRFSVCYTLNMNAVKLKPLAYHDLLSEEILRYRELELDRKLLNSPEVIAQRVERELIKRLQITAPHLIGNVIHGNN
jgi:hypothetical protein